MKNTVKFLIVLMVLTFACRQNPEKTEKECFTKAIEQIKVDSRYRWVAVMS
ncbi:MAG: hypothetical protein LBV74_13600 [Tannerella sp.]|jgi:hypothetical protein|nr:hypothetical protein [Tannerella sp.]